MTTPASKTESRELSLRNRLLGFANGRDTFPKQEFLENPFLPLNAAGENLFQLLPIHRFPEIPCIWDSPQCLAGHPETGQTVFHYGAEYGFLQHCPPQLMTVEAMETPCRLWGETPLAIASAHCNLNQISPEFVARDLAKGGTLLVDIAQAGLLGQFPRSLQTREYATRRCPRTRMSLVQAAAVGKCLRDVDPQHLSPPQLQARGGVDSNAYELAAESGCLDQLGPKALTFAALATFNSFGQNPCQLAALAGHLEQVPARFLSRLLYLSQEAPDPSTQKYVTRQPIHGYGGNLGHCAAAGSALDRFPESLQSNRLFDQKNADGNLVMHIAAMYGYLHHIHPKWITPERLMTKNNSGHTVLDLCPPRDMEHLLAVPDLPEEAIQHFPDNWRQAYLALNNKDSNARLPCTNTTSIELF